MRVMSLNAGLAAQPLGLLTRADWERLPEDELRRIECVEGVLLVSPRPARRHQKIASRLYILLDAALPADLWVFQEIDVMISDNPLTVRSPDLVVMDRQAARSQAPLAAAADVRLVAEILSPGSHRTDRVTKMSEYAEAGIGEYWLIDPDARTLAVFTLGKTHYQLAGEYDGAVTLSFAGVQFAVDVAALTEF